MIKNSECSCCHRLNSINVYAYRPTRDNYCALYTFILLLIWQQIKWNLFLESVFTRVSGSKKSLINLTMKTFREFIQRVNNIKIQVLNIYNIHYYSDMLPPNIGFTFERALTLFTRSDMTPPKVNRFRWNLK